MAPLETRAVVYEDPDSRTSWGARGTDAWYCGPLMGHYCNCKFDIPKTRAYRISGSFDLFPQLFCCLNFHPSNTQKKSTKNYVTRSNN